jgi:hypothetical protein
MKCIYFINSLNPIVLIKIKLQINDGQGQTESQASQGQPNGSTIFLNN